MSHRFSILERIRSFRFAIHGVILTVQSQHNAWIHMAASIAVLAAGWYVELGRDGWLWLIAAITLVWSMEALNTAVERLADAAVPEIHPLIGQAKDAAAGAVLIAVLGAVAVGLMVLGPPLFGKLFVEVLELWLFFDTGGTPASRGGQQQNLVLWITEDLCQPRWFTIAPYEYERGDDIPRLRSISRIMAAVCCLVIAGTGIGGCTLGGC